uniref:Uncharacterized protein n=1 Tax=Salix viminalis TaxID=40686 RepID=A0A6N2M1D3_SALVM
MDYRVGTRGPQGHHRRESEFHLYHLSFRPMVPPPCAWEMISLVYTAVFKDAKAANVLEAPLETKADAVQ